MASFLPTLPTLLLSHSLSPSAPRKPSQPLRNSRLSPNLPGNPTSFFNWTNKFGSNSPAFPPHVCITRNAGFRIHLSPISASVQTEEPETKAKFQTSLSLPGCSSPLSLLGTGYREKVFAIIGVKVYAAGLYSNPAVFSKLDAWKDRSSAELEKDSALFNAIFQAPVEKSLQIILVRDLDGKTFWNALDEAISPRITSPTSVDESAISTFRGVFQGRPLIKGTFIFLTWLNTEKMMVSVSEGFPSSVDATIESSNVTSALFDVFLGGNPVSPSLKASVSKGLAAALN